MDVLLSITTFSFKKKKVDITFLPQGYFLNRDSDPSYFTQGESRSFGTESARKYKKILDLKNNNASDSMISELIRHIGNLTEPKHCFFQPKQLRLYIYILYIVSIFD